MPVLILLLAFIELFYQSISSFIVEFFDLFQNLLDPTAVLTKQDLSLIAKLLILYFPWLIFTVLLRLFFGLIKRAKKRKSGVVILLSFFQMFLPDPYAERTIKTVQVQKKKEVKPANAPKGLNRLTNKELE